MICRKARTAKRIIYANPKHRPAIGHHTSVSLTGKELGYMLNEVRRRGMTITEFKARMKARKSPKNINLKKRHVSEKRKTSKKPKKTKEDKNE